MGREVISHYCGGAAGPMYRKPHLEANRRIARARIKCIMRTAPRMATTKKTALSSITSAIVVLDPLIFFLSRHQVARTLGGR
jgi:Fe-S oxidoreductase